MEGQDKAKHLCEFHIFCGKEGKHFLEELQIWVCEEHERYVVRWMKIRHLSMPRIS